MLLRRRRNRTEGIGLLSPKTLPFSFNSNQKEKVCSLKLKLPLSLFSILNRNCSVFGMFRFPSPDALRTEGLCPLTPEEAVLMLAALGFNRGTRVFVAGANIYGGSKRLAALTSLYPNLVSKEKLLSQAELEPFKNFSSQVIKKLSIRFRFNWFV